MRLHAFAVLLFCIGLFCLEREPRAYWQSRNSNYNISVSAGGFQGPGDIVSGATAYWSCTIAYTAAYATGLGNACDLTDLTGLNPYTMKFLSTGLADFAGAASSTACAVACSVAKQYDQTGNGNDGLAPNLATQPVLAFNNIGTCADVTFNAAGGFNTRIRDLTFTTVAQPFTGVNVVRITTNTNGPIGINGGFVAFGVNSVTPPDIVITNDVLAHFLRFAASTNTLYAAQAVSNGVSSTLRVNGTTASGDTGAQASGTLQQGFYDGDSALFGFWPLGFNGTQLANMETLLRAKCGGF